MIVFDATQILLLLNPDTPAPIDATTGQPVFRCKDRIEHLVQQLTKQKVKIIIPTPALSEALIRAGAAAPQYLDIMRNSRYFQISPFGSTAAVEAAELMRQRIDRFGKLKTDEFESRAKIKFDYQIIAIARVTNATTIYTDDLGLQEMAKSIGINAQGVSSLPLPPENPQHSLDLDTDDVPDDEL